MYTMTPVALLVRAWIEILSSGSKGFDEMVALLVRAWIEM